MFKQAVAGFFVTCLLLVTGQQVERISLQKCREYAALVSNSSTCGVNLSRPFYGEIRAAEKEFPHVAILGFGNETGKEWQCAGSLISENFILASAHCFSNELGDVKFARLGDLNYAKSDDDSHAQEFEVVEIIRHPEFERRRAYNDIALLKLNKNVSFNEYVRPACLHTTKSIKYTSAIVSGWGRTSSSFDISEDLIKVAYDVIPNDACNNTYASRSYRKLPNGILEEKIVCATGKNNKDLCQGSSGSPLQVLSDVDCMVDIIGVTSFGLSCGAGHPSLYSRVSYYVPWIENIVWPQQL